MDLISASIEKKKRYSNHRGKICTYWLAGKCNRNPCRFKHGEEPSYHPRKTYPSSKNHEDFPPNAYNPHRCSKKTQPLSEDALRAPCKRSMVWKRGDHELGCEVSTKLCKRTESTNKFQKDEPFNKLQEVESHTKSGKSTAESPKKLQNPGSAEAENSSAESTVELHEPEFNNKSQEVKVPKAESGVCKQWMQRSCLRGDQCRNLHKLCYGDGFSNLATLHGHQKAVTGIALPVGSDKLFSGSRDGTVRVWDCHTGHCIRVVNLGLEIGSLMSEGSWVFVGLPNAVKAWNIKDSAEYDLSGPCGQVLALETLKDMLFAGVEDGSIVVWRGNAFTNSFDKATTLNGHSKAVVCLKAGCSKLLFSGSMDHTIRVWDVDTLQCTRILEGHTDAVTSVICWDQFLLSSSLDCTIKVWIGTDEGIEVTYTHKVDHGIIRLDGMHDAEAKPVLFCSLCDESSVDVVKLPLLGERGKLFSKEVIETTHVAPGGLFFTGDRSGSLMVWRLEQPSFASS